MNTMYEKMVAGYEDSIKQFDVYRTDYADVERCTTKCSVETLLAPWATNKERLWKMFGEKLILTKEVEYERDFEELRSEMERMLNAHHSFVQTFFARLQEELDVNVSQWRDYAYHDDAPAERFYYLCRSAMNEANLVEARLIDDMPEVIICGQRVRLARGQKTMRAIGKIARLLNLAVEFEDFRVAHSMVLNQAKLKGTLHLSIHPLDYATASDNESGWSSCMSWREGGAYRLGTVEMMNSPYVICAYLASDSVQMDIGAGEWPSKKWRAWVIVDDTFIVVNRNYPYDNEDLMRACVEWVKEMAGPHFGVQYTETNSEWEQGDHIDIDMDYMYNDLGAGHVGCYSDKTDMNYTQHINVSGPAVCMWCGEFIHYDGDCDAACTLTCPACSGRVQCSDCGSSLSEGYVCWGPDGEPYCESCYNERFTSCECCDEVVEVEESATVILPVDYKWAEDYLLPTLNADDRASYQRWMPREQESRLCTQCMDRLNLKTEYVNTLPFDRRESYWRAPANRWDAYMFTIDCDWSSVAEGMGLDENDPFWKPMWEHYVEVRKHEEIARGF